MSWKHRWERLRQRLSAGRASSQGTERKETHRRSTIETMEPRIAMTADPIWVGGVYVEEDSGSDLHGDLFYVNFKGGAPGTQLTQLIIDGDQNTPGFGVGDNFFDTVEAGLGADHAYPLKSSNFVPRIH